jgi:hypothetical protein
MKYVAPSAPLTIGGVLDNWIQLFRASFGACWVFAIIAAVVGAALVFAVAPPPASQAAIPPSQGGAVLQNFLHSFSARNGPSSLLVDVAVWFVSLLVFSALLAQQTTFVRGEARLSFGDALTQGLRQLPQLLLGSLLVLLIVAAIIIPFGLAAALIFLAMRRSPTAILAAMPIFVIMVVVLLYVTVRLQLWMAALFSENLGGAAAVRRSWDLVKGQWWRVTGVGFVSGIVIWILGVAIAALAGFVIGVIGARGVAPDAMFRRLQFIGAFAQVSRLLTMPLLTAVWLALYQDLKLRREGGDLSARAEALSRG